ncbi:MAG: TIGR04086 family membrane protein [Clostridiales bacterium]|nr:TIGR04086 family membrane protein [Clostridiales bacterium]
MRAAKVINKEKSGKGGFFKCLLKGSLMALSISLIAICIFAFILRFCDISAGAIKPINQVIKIASILIGSFFALKGVKEMGLITGFCIGIFYTALSFLVFSILNGGFNFNSTLVNDLIFGGIAGAIAGIIAVNIKGKR